MITKNKKSIVSSTIKVNAYKVVSDAVEQGVRWGILHAYKHTDTPTEDQIVDHVTNDVMSELCDVLLFTDGE